MENRMNMHVNTCPTLETSRLILRKLSLTDADELFEVFSDEKTTHHVPREKHMDKSATVAHIENLIKGINENKSFVWSVISKNEKRVIGTVSLHFKPDRVASIGAVIQSKYWGQGIATEALREIIHFGFDTIQLIRIEGKCESNNKASENVIKKLGINY